jgi:glycosyltransferase involved in cell wall biosynthesis
MNINKYNQKDTVLVISGWPETSGRAQNNYGIAWYTKETIEPVAKKYGQRFVVLSETNHDNIPKTFANDKILVLRVFDQKHPTLFPRILQYMALFNKIDRVFVHSEFCTNGGIKNFVLLIPFLALIKLFGKKITYFAHNVVTDLSGIAPHLNLDKQTISFMILNSCIRYYYWLLGLLANRIVVMDDEMKHRLITYMPKDKIVSVPFWIKDSGKTVSKITARKKLGIKKDKFVLLYFGFITWYKGADWLIDQVKSAVFGKKYKNIELILAGGEAWSLKDKLYYRNYYQSQLSKTKGCRNVKITGFVNDGDINTYFAAADVAVFPYRGLIGSSGAITYAVANRKPFILSSKMKNALNNPDYRAALSESGLSADEMVFSPKAGSFEATITGLKDKGRLAKMAKMSTIIKARRSFETQLPIYYKLLFCETADYAVRLNEVPVHANPNLAQA